MANNSVVLVLRIRLDDGTRRYADPAFSKNGKIVPLAALLHGKVERHREGIYALRYREKGRPKYREVGTDHDAAQTARLRLELELRTKDDTLDSKDVQTVPGLVPASAKPATTVTPMATVIDKRKARLLESLTTLRDGFIKKHAHGSTDSIYAYTYVAREFVALVISRGKNAPHELDEDDVIAFDRFLESLGNAKSTRASRYGYIRCFLHYCGLNPSRSDDDDETTGVMTGPAHRKLRSKPKLAVENYSELDLQKLYAVSSERHRLIWKAFRMLGLRDEELAYALWTEIDWENRVWLVRFKAPGSFPWDTSLKWKSKDSEERDLPIPDVLYDGLMTWRKKNPKAHLVFPTSGSQGDIKLLKALKSDWRSAGLNCNHCGGCLGAKNECSKAKLKTFRATYLTTMLRYVDLRSVQALAGHSSPVTTQKYLAPASQPVLQNAANAAFGPTA